MSCRPLVVDKLLNRLLKVEFLVLLTTFLHPVSIITVVELNFHFLIPLYGSYFFSKDNITEINIGMTYHKVFNCTWKLKLITFHNFLD